MQILKNILFIVIIMSIISCENQTNKTTEKETKDTVSIASSPTYTIQEIQLTEKMYVGKKATIGWDKIGEFYQTYLPEAFKAVNLSHLEMTGAPCGLYFTWDTVGKTTEMAAAIPVKEVKNDSKDFEKFEVKGGKALLVAYYGSYDKIGAAHNAIDAYIKEKITYMG